MAAILLNTWRARTWATLLVVTLFGILTVCGSNGRSEQSPPSAERKAGNMIPVVPDSLSAVLRATHIVEITVESAQPGAPEQKSDSPVVAHPVNVSVKLDANLKGSTQERPGETANLTITQYSSRISRRFALPGVWSGQSLKPGARFIVFSISKRKNGLADILPACQQILPDSAFADVNMALKSESEQLSNASLVARAQQFAPRLGQVFSEYLAAKLTDSGLPDPVTFDQTMQLLESPDLAAIARVTLFDELSSKVMASPNAPDEVANRLVVTMFRMLAMPQAEDLHEQIISPLLPNALGLSGRARKRTAESVFAKFPSERMKAEQTITHFKGEAPTAPLLAWLIGAQHSSATPR